MAEVAFPGLFSGGQREVWRRGFDAIRRQERDKLARYRKKREAKRN